uniref:Xylulose kinase-1 n=1 Tax=Tanacetum cinerariifolium TaxID=118510 RepID=A0A6L2NDP6_TANCI|nr:xylulose kinase-1 [Tanacetum cinerariifolium]
MVAYLTKSDASEGFNQIIDFLNGCYIKYALTVNPNIYISCIKQFWNTVAIKQINDVTRLQALVDRKKVVIIEAAIREVLRLDDAEGVDCLPNEEIFAELAHMGYEKPSTKLTFYKAFFSSQLKKVGTSQRIDTLEDTVIDDASNQGKIINDLDKDDIVAFMDDKDEDKKEEEAKVVEDDQVQGRQAESQAKIYKIDLDHASKVLITAATITAALIRVVVASTRRRKGVVIKDPEEESTTSSIIPADTKSKDKGKGIMVEEPKPLKKSNKLRWMKNMQGNKRADGREREQSINETLAQKAAKRRKLNEEMEDLKRHLEIVPDEDDDIYIEATSLARKVPVVDYEIINLNNKPYYKIIRADGTHQLYINFLTLLKNFDKEDLEALWSLVKERFFTSKPNNLSDDFLLTTLGLSAAKQKMMLLDSAAEGTLMLLSQIKTVSDKCCC